MHKQHDMILLKRLLAALVASVILFGLSFSFTGCGGVEEHLEELADSNGNGNGQRDFHRYDRAILDGNLRVKGALQGKPNSN